MAKGGNRKKMSFLVNIPKISLNSETNDLAARCKFNFSYFVNYGAFPIEVEWCRFHLENKPRLIGFIVPDSFHNQEHQFYRV